MSVPRQRQRGQVWKMMATTVVVVVMREGGVLGSKKYYFAEMAAPKQ